MSARSGSVSNLNSTNPGLDMPPAGYMAGFEHAAPGPQAVGSRPPPSIAPQNNYYFRNNGTDARGAEIAAMYRAGSILPGSNEPNPSPLSNNARSHAKSAQTSEPPAYLPAAPMTANAGGLPEQEDPHPGVTAAFTQYNALTTIGNIGAAVVTSLCCLAQCAID